MGQDWTDAVVRFKTLKMSEQSEVNDRYHDLFNAKTSTWRMLHNGDAEDAMLLHQAMNEIVGPMPMIINDQRHEEYEETMRAIEIMGEL